MPASIASRWHGGADGGRLHQSPRRHQGRRSHLRHLARRRQAEPHRDRGARQVGDPEAGLRGAARGREATARQRRAPVPDDARVEARRTRCRRSARQAVSDAGRRPRRDPRPGDVGRWHAGHARRLGASHGRADGHVRHHHRHRRLHRQRRGQPQLLRSPDPHLPRLRRGPRLRARDRRQGQRPRDAASRAGAPVVEGRTRRARHEHRPLPVGRGPLQADGGHLAGAARRAQPVLDPHQVAVAAARHRAAEGAGREGRADARACRSRRSIRRSGAKPSRAPPTRARAWRRSPS